MANTPVPRAALQVGDIDTVTKRGGEPNETREEKDGKTRTWTDVVDDAGSPGGKTGDRESHEYTRIDRNEGGLTKRRCVMAMMETHVERKTDAVHVVRDQTRSGGAKTGTNPTRGRTQERTSARHPVGTCLRSYRTSVQRRKGVLVPTDAKQGGMRRCMKHVLDAQRTTEKKPGGPGARN